MLVTLEICKATEIGVDRFWSLRFFYCTYQSNTCAPKAGFKENQWKDLVNREEKPCQEPASTWAAHTVPEVAHPLVHKATWNAIWIQAEKININTHRAAYQRQTNRTLLPQRFIPSKSILKAWEFGPVSLSSWNAKAYYWWRTESHRTPDFCKHLQCFLKQKQCHTPKPSPFLLMLWSFIAFHSHIYLLSFQVGCNKGAHLSPQSTRKLIPG